MNKKITSILIGMFILAMSIMPMSALDREECGTLIGTPEIAGGSRPETTNQNMQVYPLHIGDTLVSYEQFYSGNDEWDVPALNVLVDSERFFWAPVYMFLIVHPELGPILVDTAFNDEMANNYDEYFSGIAGVSSRLMKEEYMLDESQTIPAQLAHFGYTPEDIELVILTHAHDDHVGGLPYFQHARIVVAQNEFLFIEIVSRNQLPINGKYYEGVTCWEPINFTDDAVANFESSQDVLGDGSIMLIPAPGHTAGSLMVLVDMGEYNLLLTGDTIYTMYHLDPDNILQLIPETDPQELTDMVQSVVTLRDSLPNTFIVPAHDHMRFLEEVIPSLMNCGILSENDQERTRDYQAMIFDEEGHIRSEYMPIYIANEDGTIYGTVQTPEIDLSASPPSSEDCD